MTAKLHNVNQQVASFASSLPSYDWSVANNVQKIKLTSPLAVTAYHAGVLAMYHLLMSFTEDAEAKIAIAYAPLKVFANGSPEGKTNMEFTVVSFEFNRAFVFSSESTTPFNSNHKVRLIQSHSASRYENQTPYGELIFDEATNKVMGATFTLQKSFMHPNFKAHLEGMISEYNSSPERPNMVKDAKARGKQIPDYIFAKLMGRYYKEKYLKVDTNMGSINVFDSTLYTYFMKPVEGDDKVISLYTPVLGIDLRVEKATCKIVGYNILHSPPPEVKDDFFDKKMPSPDEINQMKGIFINSINLVRRKVHNFKVMDLTILETVDMAPSTILKNFVRELYSLVRKHEIYKIDQIDKNLAVTTFLALVKDQKMHLEMQQNGMFVTHHPALGIKLQFAVFQNPEDDNKVFISFYGLA